MWPHSRRPQVLVQALCCFLPDADNCVDLWVADVQITLIDQNEQFVFKPLLYELINGGATPEEVAPMFADLLAPMNSTSFVQVRNHA